MNLLRRLLGGRSTPSVSFNDDHEAALLEIQYRVRKQLRKMSPEEARAALRGEIIRMGLRDATAVAIYNNAHPQEAT